MRDAKTAILIGRTHASSSAPAADWVTWVNSMPQEANCLVWLDQRTIRFVIVCPNGQETAFREFYSMRSRAGLPAVLTSGVQIM